MRAARRGPSVRDIRPLRRVDLGLLIVTAVEKRAMPRLANQRASARVAH